MDALIGRIEENGIAEPCPDMDVPDAVPDHHLLAMTFRPPVDEGEADRLRAAFARLEQVKQAIGRVGYAALSRQLPFSNNDEWELNELKELIDRD